MLICDHCGWSGPNENLVRLDLLEFGACPACWADGYESEPRERMGSLMEAFAPPDPESVRPKRKKRLIFLDDEEFAIESKVLRAKVAHESAPVRLETTIAGASQLGMDFMREEFRVKGRSA